MVFKDWLVAALNRVAVDDRGTIAMVVSCVEDLEV